MPPHRGHLYLIEFAQAMCQHLTVVVGSLPGEPIPGGLRFDWMKELFPQLEVLHLQDENPQYPEEHPDFWAIWRRSLQRLHPEPIEWLFASEDYGLRLAQELGGQFVPTNGGRQIVGVSGTAVRQNPWRYWHLLPAPVRRYYLRTVSIFGPESTGKTTLAQALAEHFNTLWVPEFARTWLEMRQVPIELADMDFIAQGQRASEQALARLAQQVLICDTDPLLTVRWSEELFGLSSPLLHQVAQQGHYHLTLLTSPDVPWESDPVRYRPEQRQEFWEACRLLLEQQQRPYLMLQGPHAQRMQVATAAIASLLLECPTGSPIAGPAANPTIERHCPR